MKSVKLTCKAHTHKHTHCCLGDFAHHIYSGTDVYNNGTGGQWAFSNDDPPAPLSDPCTWFGVNCSASGQHVVGLFPNPRNSGNPLVGNLPASIGAFHAGLEHLYTSNDVSQSWLSGLLPASVGELTQLKCMYFSHNNISGALPPSLTHLTKLQVIKLGCLWYMYD